MLMRDKNERPIYSYSRSHETFREHRSSQSSNELDYNTSLAYVLEVINLRTPTNDFVKLFLQLTIQQDLKHAVST